MDVWRFVREVYGVQSAARTGTFMMLELYVGNLNFMQKVQTIFLNMQPYFTCINKDVEVTDVFGLGGTVFMSNVQCNGTEEGLHLCPSAQIGNVTCQERSNSAGVICSKHFGKMNTSLPVTSCQLHVYETYCHILHTRYTHEVF